MKKIKIIIFILLYTQLGFSQTDTGEQLKFVIGSFKQQKADYTQENEYEIGSANLLERYIKDWPLDRNGNYPTALIRVKFKNLPLSEADKLDFNFPAHCSKSRVVKPSENKQPEYWLFVDAVENCWIQAIHPEYGLSKQFNLTMPLEQRKIYEITLENEKTINISIVSNPAEATVYLDGSNIGVTPCQKSGVKYGIHELTLTYGGKVFNEKIQVLDGNTHFEFDLRERRIVSIQSDPSDATLYINRQAYGRTPVKNLELPFGSYEMIATLNNEQADTLNITIDGKTPEVVTLTPVKKKSIEVFAKYGGQNVSSSLHVNNKLERNENASHRITLPYGKHNLRVSHRYRNKSMDIRVNKNSPSVYTIKIPTKNKAVMPWEREYNPRPFGVSFGYVSKQWVSKGEGERVRENVWLEDGQRLHGFQIGLRMQPHFQWGLGMSTGLYYEFYISDNSEMRDNGYMDRFQEHNIYVPVHASYRLPLSTNFAIFIQGGLGMDCGVYAQFSSTEDENVDPVTDYYGEEYCPKRFNLAAEVNLGFHIKGFQFNALYSKGLLDHKFYTEYGDYKTHQNKLSISISYMIGNF